MATEAIAVPGLAPFDSAARADLVLRTTDNKLLFTYKTYLTAVSPFFSNLLLDGKTDESYHGLPLCPVLEDTGTMHFILRVCSPYHITIDDLLVAATDSAVFVALDKYMMDIPKERIAGIIRDGARYVVADNALSIYALACAFGLREIAQEAARYAIAIPVTDWIMPDKVARILSSMDYHRLLRYHNKCGDVVHKAAAIGLKTNDSSLNCFRCHSKSAMVQYLCIGPHGFAIHLYNRTHTFRHEQLPEYAEVARIANSYRHRPGQKISLADVDFLCSLTMRQCGGSLVDVRPAIQAAFDKVQEDVAAAIAEVPLYID
ncbi:hypothetical protein CYLTODRAFT_397279 [Cylindrobasidium torrendii FP15055 ss-10]|uniref:BTB domain-containing protein n=1 Tax=Cylindrobasidium torrendii FP15055 ss-10 TaxID=1314674 RepID=A0A0D7B9Y3_9AGAR|nr:hypothetical protein CYLTODRAFT_397279 [Cylindrobasidium torrendii FP15055 ss-10]